MIRNATRPVFHKGNSSKKEKEKRTKKEKEKWPVENAAAMEIREQSVAFGSFFLMRIPTAAWKSRAKALGFCTFTTGPATIHQYGTNLHLSYYKGWMRPLRKCREASLAGAAGVVGSSHRLSEVERTTPSAPSEERDHFLDGAATPPLPRRGVSFGCGFAALCLLWSFLRLCQL
jgi:hypothetical protein